MFAWMFHATFYAILSIVYGHHGSVGGGAALAKPSNLSSGLLQLTRSFGEADSVSTALRTAALWNVSMPSPTKEVNAMS
eukprot:COSAG03_NODE_7428_length_919_cov_30.513415_2_plen_79_part_00